MWPEIWGLRVGDVVSVSYSHRRYVVERILGPYYYHDLPHDPLQHVSSVAVRTWPVVDLVARDQEDAHVVSLGPVRQAGPRYLTDQNDEIVIESRLLRSPVQLPLLPPEYGCSTPYPFQAGVDYALRWPPQVWKCCRCRVDFNAVPERSGTVHRYPAHCGHSPVPVFVMERPADDPRRPYPSEYQYSLGVAHLQQEDNGELYDWWAPWLRQGAD